MSEAGGPARGLGIDARRWLGWQLDDARGARTGSVETVYEDPDGGEVVWLGVRMGRFGHRSAVPLAHCAGAYGRVWVAHDRDQIRDAPKLEPDEPLKGEQADELRRTYRLAG